MHKITRINNATGEVTITHENGEEHSFTISAGYNKHEYVKEQMRLHAEEIILRSKKELISEPAKPSLIKRLWSKLWPTT